VLSKNVRDIFENIFDSLEAENVDFEVFLGKKFP
jgi:hypothetical protein